MEEYRQYRAPLNKALIQMADKFNGEMFELAFWP